MKPILSKVEAISSFPKPDTKTAVRAFLGLAGYYRRFIPDFASVAAPLTDLTKKSVPNSGVWNEGCQRAFETLKKALISEPVLSVARMFQKHLSYRLMLLIGEWEPF